MNDHGKIAAWLSLSMIPGLGNTVLRRLVREFGETDAIFGADLKALMKVAGMRSEVAAKIAGGPTLREAEQEIERAEKSHARIITYTDPSYPPLLREIHNPPMVLYAKGREIPPAMTLVSVVGSRNPTHYGLKAAEALSLGLAKRGVGVVSGMARGIDTAAHRGCLMGNGFTVAVVGTGIDVVYPVSNGNLFSRIEKRGTIISEFPMGAPPEPRNFPMRNRIISGLSRGTVVVEATKRSGSLITASLALEQNREVFAVPGSIDSFKSTGTHGLIKRGEAKLIENAEDILSEFGFMGSGKTRNGTGDGPDNTLGQMNDLEKKVYQIIGDYPMHIDTIVRLGKMHAGKVSGILMKLELEGLVKQLPGKMYVR